MGAEGFHGRVRDGIGCGPLAMATRSSKPGGLGLFVYQISVGDLDVPSGAGRGHPAAWLSGLTGPTHACGLGELTGWGELMRSVHVPSPSAGHGAHRSIRRAPGSQARARTERSEAKSPDGDARRLREHSPEGAKIDRCASRQKAAGLVPWGWLLRAAPLAVS